METGEAELEIPIYGGIRGIHPTDDPNRVLAVTESGTIHTITLDPAEVVSIATSRIGREPTAGECEFYGLRSCG